MHYDHFCMRRFVPRFDALCMEEMVKRKICQDNMFACYGSESHSPHLVSILGSDITYGVLRRCLTLVSRFSFVSSRGVFQLRFRPALIHRVGCT
jgi:hypothetical protein